MDSDLGFISSSSESVMMKLKHAAVGQWKPSKKAKNTYILPSLPGPGHQGMSLPPPPPPSTMTAVAQPFPDKYVRVYTPDDYYIAGITFGVKGPDEILAQSVCEITENTIYNKNVPRHDAINDVRMGTVDRRIVCGTCGHGVEKCNGHTGHINLPVALYNVGFIGAVLRILRTVCYFCSKLLVPPEALQETNIKFNVQKFDHITSSARSYHECWSCHGKMPSFKQKGLVIERHWDASVHFEDADEKKLAERVFDAGLAREILECISDEDCVHMGLNPLFARPEFFITTVLLIPPPLIRPAIMITEGSKAKGQDDLTRKLQDVLKKSFVVRALLKKCKGNMTDKTLSKAVDDLQYDYAVYLNNELKGVPQDTQRSGAPIRGVAQRIKAKGGLIRGHMNGKRVDFSSRTVVSADPQLDVDELGVPVSLATILTKPVTVTALTIEECSRRVINGADRIDGASMIEYPNGRTKTLSACVDRHLLPLPFGSKVHRYLKNGDVVLFNRHPSLHKESIMAHRVVLMSTGQTFRMNLAATKPYNADFDGDEMNMHVVQSLEAEAELREPMAVHNHILGAQSNSPTMGLVQDGLTGIYLMTRKDVFLTRDEIMSLMMVVKYEAPFRKQWQIPHPAIVKPVPLWTGKQVISMILPPLFLEKYVRGADKQSTSLWDVHERVVVLRAGNLLAGTLCKATVGSAAGGIIHIMTLDYDGRVTCNFMSDVQRLVNAWLLIEGFSVGVSDCLIDDETGDRIHRKIKSTMRKVGKIYNQIKKIPNLPIDAAEPPVFRTLSEVLNSAGTITSFATGQKNRINCMISSGGKGNNVNIAQITACVGQQSVEGRRIALKKNDRTLNAFSTGSLDPRSRGFVASSYTHGLNPTEFFFHGMGGREGLVDTAVKSVTGDTDIVICQQNKLSRVKIGVWIDDQLDKQSKEKIEYYPNEANMELLRISGVYIPTVDDHGALTWGEITAITRHDPSPNLYLLTTESGRQVRVVESKSLLVFDHETQTLKQTQTTDVNIGDLLPVTITYPVPPGDNNFHNKIVHTLADLEKCGRVVLVLNDDGDADHTFMTIELDNESQMEKTAWLLSGLSIFSHLQRKSSTLVIRKPWLSRFIEILGEPTCVKNLSGNNTSYSVNRIFNNVLLDPVISIHQYASDRGQKVYDLTVPSTLNFGIANGLQVADTSETGYLQRRMMKAMESMRVNYDQTVRDAQGMIMDFCYGGDGLDATFLDSKTDLVFLDWTFDRIHEFVYGGENGGQHDCVTFADEESKLLQIKNECVQSKITPLTLLLDRTAFLPMSISRVIDHAKMLVRHQRIERETMPPQPTQAVSNPAFHEAVSNPAFHEAVSNPASDPKFTRSLFPKTLPYRVRQRPLPFSLLASAKPIPPPLSQPQETLSPVEEYRPTSPRYEPTSPRYVPPASQRHEPTSPRYEPTSPRYEPTSPRYEPTTSSQYRPTTPQYRPTSPQYRPTSPRYEPTSPRYQPTSPRYEPTTPDFCPKKSPVATQPLPVPLTYAEVWIDVQNMLKTVGRQSLYLRAALQFTLASRRVVDTLKLTRDEWTEIKKIIDHKWERSRAQPGEMVGALSAESVGEGGTQGTLNTFHFSGIAAKNVTLGVPRLKELLDVSKNIKIPSLTVFLKSMYNLNEEMVSSFASSLERTCLEEVVMSDVISEPDFFHSKYSEDQEMLDLSRPFYSHLDLSRQFVSSYVIRFKLNKHLLISRNYSSVNVVDAIQSFVGDKAYVWYNPPEHNQWIIRIRLADIKNAVEKLDEGRRKQTDRALTRALQNTLVKNVIIGGLKNIEKATARQMNVSKISSSSGCIEKTKEWVIDTEGSGFASIGILPSVDWKRTYSNDVSEIFEVLGLEAAVFVLFNELKSVLSFNGSTINDRHIMMIVNTMTYRGTLMSFNRFGFNRQHDTSVLGRSSFEEPMETLTEGGIFGQHDALQGVSERIMVGRRADIGTNSFGQQVAPDMFQFNKPTQKTWRTCVSAAWNPWEKSDDSGSANRNSIDSPPPSPLLRSMEFKNANQNQFSQLPQQNSSTHRILKQSFRPTKGVSILDESFSPVISPVVQSDHGCHLDTNYFTLTQSNHPETIPYRPSSPDMNSTCDEFVASASASNQQNTTQQDNQEDTNPKPRADCDIPVTNPMVLLSQPAAVASASAAAATTLLTSQEICHLLDTLESTGMLKNNTRDKLGTIEPPTVADFEKLRRDMEAYFHTKSLGTQDSIMDEGFQ